MAAEVGAAGIGAGAELGGAVAQQTIFNPKENKRLQEGAKGQTQEIDSALAMLMNGDNSGLRATASRELGSSLNSLGAGFSLNNAGATNAGALDQMRSRVASDTFSNLSSAIAQEDLTKQLAFLAAKQQPVYQQAATPSRGKK